MEPTPNLFPILICSLILPHVLAAPNTFFIAPDGSDDAAGTINAPFATLERARTAVRESKAQDALSEQGITVFLRGGIYQRRTAFQLNHQDAGTLSSPVTFRAYENEQVRLIGGRPLPADRFETVKDSQTLARLPDSARGKVLAADLRAMGITEYGRFPLRFRGAPLVPELFCDNQRMTLARWPNEGWATVGKVIEKGAVPRHGDKSTTPGVFQYSGDRPARWKTADHVWLHGYWHFDWYDEAIKVKSIDTEKRRITFAAPHHYGLEQRGERRYYAMNLLEELDTPGEYYIDRSEGILYFWPPADLTNVETYISTLEDPLISLDNTSHVVIRGITLEVCRGTALVVAGGSNNRILACHIRNAGNSAISVTGGENHQVASCDIQDVGVKGIILRGGDRPTLTPAGHEASNNHIWRFSRRQRTYAPAIEIGGVGQWVDHNLIHHAPHSAILLGGNEHVIEFNEVHHVTMETDDCGAFYMGRNPSHRGTILRYNFWHHIGSPLGHGNNAVYFDDGDGGQTVFGNVFLRCGNPGRAKMGAVFCHGGHDNLIENNIFIECKRAIGASPWNDRRWKSMIEGQLWQKRLLQEVDITTSPYTTSYPRLRGFMQPSGEPRMNKVVRNLAVMCGAFVRGNYITEDNFVTDDDPGFINPEKGQFGLKPASIAFKNIPGFEPIPFDEIGLCRTYLRPTLPHRTWDYPPPQPLAKAQPEARLPDKTGPPPGFHVPPREAPIAIDGNLRPTEWLHLGTDRAMQLRQDLYGRAAEPESRAWLLADNAYLWIGITNDVSPEPPLKTGTQWGRDDAVEIAIRNAAAGEKAPTIVLRGYPNGRFEASAEAGAPPEVVTRSAEGVLYDAGIPAESIWTAEWRIPFESLDIDPSKHGTLQFNLTVRKSAQPLWLMWEGTDGYSWLVDRAGLIHLPAPSQGD